jgi:hypothetical protein
MYIDDALRAAIRTRWRADTAVRALPRSRQGEAMNTSESSIFRIMFGYHYIVFLNRAANATKEEIETAFTQAGAIVTIVYTDAPVKVE